MPCAALKNSLLDARDARQRQLERSLQATDDVLIQLSLNIPGADKQPEQACKLFNWGDRQLHKVFPLLMQVYQGSDALGPWALYMTSLAAVEAKRLCCAIEEKTLFARLLDLDVYRADGEQIGRNDLGMTARRCLVCQAEARQCIRTGAHDQAELEQALQQLLQSVSA